MQALATSTQTIDYEAFINDYLYGTSTEPSAFETNDKREDYTMPSTSREDMSDFIIEEILTIDAELSKSDEDGYVTHNGASSVAGICLETVYANGADTAVEWLQDDLHEIFPNEKTWPHLDALADTAARKYYKELENTMHDLAVDVLGY